MSVNFLLKIITKVDKRAIPLAVQLFNRYIRGQTQMQLLAAFHAPGRFVSRKAGTLFKSAYVLGIWPV